MHEYDAIRGEVLTSLANQVSILSFGAATVGLLIAAAAALWSEEHVLSGLLVLAVAPNMCFLTLIVYLSEQVRLMRAGLFLCTLEKQVNGLLTEEEMLLSWEHWFQIRKGAADVDRHSRWAITVVFTLMALGFISTGYFRLHQGDIWEGWASAALAVTLCATLSSLVWIYRLGRFAKSYRDSYIASPIS